MKSLSLSAAVVKVLQRHTLPWGFNRMFCTCLQQVFSRIFLWPVTYTLQSTSASAAMLQEGAGCVTAAPAACTSTAITMAMKIIGAKATGIQLLIAIAAAKLLQTLQLILH